MKKKTFLLLGAILASGLLIGCSNNANEVMVPIKEENIIEDTQSEPVIDETDEETLPEESTETAEINECPLEDGIYLADFNTDSTMFHVNEMCDGKGELTVKDGKMSIHISLPSKSIVNLYFGVTEDAKKDGAVLLEPTADTIDYDDGTTEEVNGFDVPVPYLDDEYDVALIGKKGVWYDHKVYVTNPVLKSESENTDESSETSETAEVSAIETGDYTIEVKLDGGTGKATITSPCRIISDENGMKVIIEWSSPNYDYMIVHDEKYLPVNTEGNSVFEIPVLTLDTPLEVIADTIAMSKPHEIEYTLIFDTATIKKIE
ncbi:MAG: hypothetical protein K6G75_05710 [Lachnospiraceae bacterium]|nr:hypothetical protein [Lachnospiraceae bacterium]